MFINELEQVANAAIKKEKVYKNNKLGFFILSVLAGMYIGFGGIFTFTIAGLIEKSMYAKIVGGICFSVALSLVSFAGAELFTGNTFVMMTGLLKKKVTLKTVIEVLVLCWIGNLCGSILLSFMFYLTGFDSGNTANMIAQSAVTKMTVAPIPLLVRAILCNILVCLAVWCGYRTKSDTAKLIMIFWCIFVFYTCGFEHSIANMTTLTLGMIQPLHQIMITSLGYIYNLVIVTIGNIIGGCLFVAIPYFISSKNV